MGEQPKNAPELTPLQQLALERIHYFKQQLAEYGLYPQVGMELEFMVKDDTGRPVPGRVQVDKALDYLRTQEAMPQVLRFYHEGLHSRDPRNWPSSIEYEVTVGATPQQAASGWHDEMPAPEAVAADVVKLTSGALARMLRSATCLNTPDTARLLLSPDFRPYPAFDDEKFRNHAHESAALHINISLMDAYGNNMLARSHELLLHCANSLVNVQKEGMLAFMPNGNASLSRIRNNKSTPKGFGLRWGNRLSAHQDNYSSVSIRYDGDREDFLHSITPSFDRVHVRDGGKSLRLENRIPGADADPYVALALMLGALAEAVRKNAVHHPAETDIAGLLPVDAASGLYTKPYAATGATEGVSTHAGMVHERYQKSRYLQRLLGAPLYDAIAQEYAPHYMR